MAPIPNNTEMPARARGHKWLVGKEISAQPVQNSIHASRNINSLKMVLPMVLFNPSDDLPLRKSKQRWHTQNIFNFDKLQWIEDVGNKINEYFQVLGSYGRTMET